CDLVIAQLGKSRRADDVGPDDFAPLRNKMAKRWGAHRLGKLIQYTPPPVKHPAREGLIDPPPRRSPPVHAPRQTTGGGGRGAGRRGPSCAPPRRFAGWRRKPARTSAP